jgi:hypothetical protein
VFLRARYYDPVVGRFWSKDPVPGSAINTQTINRYPYVTGNPLRYVDPTGEQLHEDYPGQFIIDHVWHPTMNFIINRGIPALNRVIEPNPKEIMPEQGLGILLDNVKEADKWTGFLPGGLGLILDQGTVFRDLVNGHGDHSKAVHDEMGAIGDAAFGLATHIPPAWLQLPLCLGGFRQACPAGQGTQLQASTGLRVAAPGFSINQIGGHATGRSVVALLRTPGGTIAENWLKYYRSYPGHVGGAWGGPPSNGK